MILVTGTKRSGTSLWMQILIAAGFPHIGREYMGHWRSSIGDANKKGFYESLLRDGIYYKTNPHPKTGRFLRPEQVQRHVVKVFVPGMVRTELGYIDRVIASMRPWREYAVSIDRLFAMEDAWLAEQPPTKDGTPALEFVRARRGSTPPEIAWWYENYDMIRNIVTRRLPARVISYDRLLEAPRPVLRKALEFLGEGDLDAAVAQVDPSLRTQHAPPERDWLVDAAAIDVMDAVYAAVREERGFDRDLLDAMNDTQRHVRALDAARREAAGEPASEE